MWRKNMCFLHNHPFNGRWNLSEVMEKLIFCKKYDGIRPLSPPGEGHAGRPSSLYRQNLPAGNLSRGTSADLSNNKNYSDSNSRAPGADNHQLGENVQAARAPRDYKSASSIRNAKRDQMTRIIYNSKSLFPFSTVTTSTISSLNLARAFGKSALITDVLLSSVRRFTFNRVVYFLPLQLG